MNPQPEVPHMAGFYPLTATLVDANERRTAYIDGELHLFQSSLNPSPNNVLADYTTAECDFDGYALIVVAAANWPNPGYSPSGGAALQSCCSQFEYVFSGGITNNVGGWYFVDVNGDLRAVGVFGTPYPMAQNGDVLPVEMQFIFPTGA